MRGRGIIAAVVALLVFAIIAVWFLFFREPSTPDVKPGAKTGTAVSEAKTPAQVFADIRGRYEKSLPDPAAREKMMGEIRRSEVSAALSGVVADRSAPLADRQLAFEALARARVKPEVLFPLIVQLSEEKTPDFQNPAAEALASLLVRGEKAPDEEKATVILVLAAKPSDNSSARIAAARGLAKLTNSKAIAARVGQLSDEDRLARKFTIEGLKALANDTYGYDYRTPPGKQRAAIAKWEEWAKAYQPAKQ